ncbi:HNH endonuclease signature motif containing protein [Mycolicibacterium baixiangningiae]|uniref:HNH endonuclease signature motif containing protein n=1 Tax=Mycolicibacterium baixiangningiae TaxID=2761578 RepID=UPI0018D00DDE|nr:HNH endonuclease signature motif containing protein [Mycolicibacterium baixiangningiae]
MFEELVEGVFGAAAVGAWARAENAACARRLKAVAELLESRLGEVDAADREQWCLANWDAVSAEVGAEMNVSLGVASHQLTVAKALHDRLPRLAEVFATGAVSYRLVNAVVFRTALIKDAETMAAVDAAVAAHADTWMRLTADRAEQAIDYWVDRHDPYALRRTGIAARSRGVTVDVPDGSGTGAVWATLYADDAAVLDNRLDSMARAVCDDDPRDLGQRRADALGALVSGDDGLECRCGRTRCPAAITTPGCVVVHVIAEETSLSASVGAQLDGADPERKGPGKTLRQMTLGEAFWQPAPTGPTIAGPGVMLGGGLLPAPVLAEVGRSATIRRLVHPGDAPPENGCTPSQALADFVRCRDLTCRFPGCDQPAQQCGIDHTIPWPAGPTQAANLKALCREHHLLKRFREWRDEQLPDGTVVWRSPGGRAHTTHPGSALLFPSLCRPTAAVEQSGGLSPRACTPGPAP